MQIRIASQAACDSTPDVAAWAVCGAVTLSLWELVHGTEQKLRICELHGGNVNGAETEAAYENTRTILDMANFIKKDAASIRISINNEENFTDDVELASHSSEVLAAISGLNNRLTDIEDKLDAQQAQLDVVIELLNTPEGQRPDWNKKP